MNKLIKDKSGITLIELLVSIAVFSVMMVSVFTFLNVASRQYTKSSNEVAVQNEAQTLLTQLENIITEANCLVVVQDHETYILNNDSYTIIQWDDVNEKIYLFDYSSPSTQYVSSTDKDEKLTIAMSTALPTVTESNSRQYLLAEYVEDFTPAAHLEYDYVTIQLVMKKDNVSFPVSKNLYMRNTLVAKSAGGGAVSGGGSGSSGSSGDSSDAVNSGDASGDSSGSGSSGDSSGDSLGAGSSGDSSGSGDSSDSSDAGSDGSAIEPDLSGVWVSAGYSASNVGNSKTVANPIKALRVTYTLEADGANGAVVIGNWDERFSFSNTAAGTYTETFASGNGTLTSFAIYSWYKVTVNSVEYLYE